MNDTRRAARKTAKESIVEAEASIDEALRVLGVVVLHQADGYTELSESYQAKVRDAFAALLKMRDELEMARKPKVEDA